MGDGEFSILGQILFTVKKQNDRLFFEKISPDLANESQSEFEKAFSRQAIKEIAVRCTLTLSGEDGTGSFSTSLFGCSYIVTLITQIEHVFIFIATEKPNGKSERVSTHSAFLKLYNTTADGIFFWRVQNHDFSLSYANASYFLQTGLPSHSLRKKPDEIFSPKKASLIRCQMAKCLNSLLPVSYISKYNKRTFAVTLYPEIRDEQVKRIMGLSLDISELIYNIIQLEQKIQTPIHEHMFHDHIRYEQILSCAAREFLDSGLSGFNECVERFVKNLGPLFDVDWAFACKSNNAICGSSTQWLARAESGRDRLLTLTESTNFDMWAAQLRAGRIIVVNDIHKELPSLYAALTCAGSPEIRSLLVVPVLRSDEFWGVLCVSSFHQKRIWATKEIGMLKNASEIIMSAYLRIKMEKQLSESNRVLVEYDECLQDMLSVQESLATVSRRFLTMEPKDFGSCATDMLSTLSELTDIDQACITLIADASPKCYFWHKKGLPFQSRNYDKFNFVFSGLSDFLNDIEQIAIDDVSEGINSLPVFTHDYILSTGLKSLLIVPIRNDNTIVAVLYLSKVLGNCRWDNPTIHTAKLFADLFSGAYLKIYTHQQLLEQVKDGSTAAKATVAQAELIKSIAECTQPLIDATAENLPSVYSNICKSIAQHLPADTINLTQYSQDYTKTFIVFNWRASGPLSKGISSGSSHHDNVVISIPVFYRDIVWGCLLVNLTSQPPSDGFMKVLEMVAESFVRAYMRIHPDRKNMSENPKRAAISLSPHPFAI